MFRSLEKAIFNFLVVRIWVGNTEYQSEFRGLFAYLKDSAVEYVFSKLNSFHNNIQFP